MGATCPRGKEKRPVPQGMGLGNLENSCPSLLISFLVFTPGLKAGCDYEPERTTPDSGQGPITQRLHTHTLPQAWALGQRRGFPPRGSHPTAQMMCGRHLKREQERKVGGRRRGQILFPPCLSQCFANTRALQCPQEEGKHSPARAQGWMCAGAGFASPRHTTPVMSCFPSPFLLLSPAGHPPEPPHGARHPAGATLLPRWPSPCRDNCMESCRSFVSSLLAASSGHTWEKPDTVRTHTLTKPTPNLDQYQRELITGSCIFR